jgi:hypothetical protein
MANPTWNDPIKTYFRPFDIESMEPMGINLGDYGSVKEHAAAILDRVAEGSMPCDGPWVQTWVDTFRQWVNDGTPES